MDLDDSLSGWNDWKKSVHDEVGLSFSVDYSALYQTISGDAPEDDAAAGMVRSYGSWTLAGRGSDSPGALVFKIEHRYRLGTDASPLLFAFGAGSALPTGAPFGDYGAGLTNLYWQQKISGGQVSFLGGLVDVTDDVDIYGMVNPWTQVQNLAFLTNPTIAAPNPGLGLAMAFA